MRVLVYGGRYFGHFSACSKGSSEYMIKRKQFESGLAFIDKCAEEYMPKLPQDEYGNYLPDVTIVSGGATGADSIGEEWAVINWQELECFPADWKTHGKAAGMIRNQHMLDSGIDLAIEFPGERGTADMRRRLNNAGVKVIEYKINTSN